MNKQIIVGIDLDGTLANPLKPVLRLVEDLTNHKIKEEECVTYKFLEKQLGISTPALIQLVWKFYTNEVLPYLPVVDIRSILPKEQFITVIVTSTRNDTDGRYKIGQWLNKWFPNSFDGTLYIPSDKKLSVVDFLVDDNPLLPDVDTIYAIERPWNKHTKRHHVNYVNQLEEALKQIVSRRS